MGQQVTCPEHAGPRPLLCGLSVSGIIVDLALADQRIPCEFRCADLDALMGVDWKY